MNNSDKMGIELRQKPEKEGRYVLKGTSKRVIVVKSPDRQYFEEAIFIVKEEFLSSPGVTKDKLLSEACKAADGYISKGKGRTGYRTGLIVAISSISSSGILFAVLKLLGM